MWTLAAPHRWIAGFIAAAILFRRCPSLWAIPARTRPCCLPRLEFSPAHSTSATGTSPPAPSHERLVCLFSILLASAAFAAFYSGLEIALQTLARALLFGIGVYVFFYAAYMRPEDHPPGLRPLFWVALASAAIACVDFYFQLPAPAGFGPQFVWTRYRRLPPRPGYFL